MSFTFAASLSTAGLFLGMLILFDVGRRIGNARLASDMKGVAKGAPRRPTRSGRPTCS